MRRIFSKVVDILCLIPCLLMLLIVLITVNILLSVDCMKTYQAIEAAMNYDDDIEYWQRTAW